MRLRGGCACGTDCSAREIYIIFASVVGSNAVGWINSVRDNPCVFDPLSGSYVDPASLDPQLSTCVSDAITLVNGVNIASPPVSWSSLCVGPFIGTDPTDCIGHSVCLTGSRAIAYGLDNQGDPSVHLTAGWYTPGCDPFIQLGWDFLDTAIGSNALAANVTKTSGADAALILGPCSSSMVPPGSCGTIDSVNHCDPTNLNGPAQNIVLPGATAVRVLIVSGGAVTGVRTCVSHTYVCGLDTTGTGCTQSATPVVVSCGAATVSDVQPTSSNLGSPSDDTWDIVSGAGYIYQEAIGLWVCGGCSDCTCP